MSLLISREGRSQVLTGKSLSLAAHALAKRDELLARLFKIYGVPPLWRRSTGFATLVHIILEQQVSLRAGQAMLDRLQLSVQPFLPERFLELGEPYLRSLGVTRQKAAYLTHLAGSVVNGQLNLKKLGRKTDADAKLLLMQVKGIGSWSADVYLLMAMRRADAWPAGDLALAVAVQELRRLDQRPGPGELEELAENWRPHRAVAARMLWQYYLSRRKQIIQRKSPI
jgi:DNA-3-methyladenine glycosylase II